MVVLPRKTMGWDAPVQISQIKMKTIPEAACAHPGAVSVEAVEIVPDIITFSCYNYIWALDVVEHWMEAVRYYRIFGK